MIKEFWQEVKQERKERKRLKKERKKRALTGEQKATKIFGIFLGFFVLFGSLFFACNNMSIGDLDFSWGTLVGLDKEIVEELEKPVDENLLLIDGKINSEDYMSFISAWIAAGADGTYFNEDGELIEGEGDSFDEEEREVLFIDETLTLSGKQLGGWCRESNIDLGYVSTMDILDMKFYKENDQFYLSTIAFCKLSKLLGSDEVPNVYLRTVSPIKVLDGNITTLGCELYINNLSEESNKVVVDKINELSQNKLSTLVNDLVVTAYINPLKQIFNATIELVDNTVVFIPVGV